jgi:methylated-DNA-protein-cysteine methyltransferase related protein
MKSKKQKADDNFFSKVYQVARKIPRGRVTSYGAIAEYLGTKGSARMVGWAMNASGSQFPPVPAQRVVNRNGLLTGKNHFSYPEQMQELLEAEGVEVIHDKVKHFEEIFWNPLTELR